VHGIADAGSWSDRQRAEGAVGCTKARTRFLNPVGIAALVLLLAQKSGLDAGGTARCAG
jgi:hypothetical protein